MVSERVILVLLLVAIVFSIFSMIVTYSDFGSKWVPESLQSPGDNLPDSSSGMVSLTVDKMTP